MKIVLQGQQGLAAGIVAFVDYLLISMLQTAVTTRMLATIFLKDVYCLIGGSNNGKQDW